jgi:ABC-type transport system involved in multi-copper enzyme maturation permease subunit
MRQSLALLLDAYRDMNSRKMFWIALILSTIVAASFFAVGISDAGVSIFGHVFFTDYNTRFVSRGEFYKEFFLGYGVDFWLSLIAVALALVTTASIFPEFLAGGAVDLYLAKPISRIRLFLTKYFCGLVYVAMQVSCFCATCFLVIGIRGGEWLPGIFLAVPIVLLFYSYLYAICVFWGVWTRSTIAALMLTILAWFVIFGIQTAELALLRIHYGDVVQAQDLDDRIAAQSAEIKRLDAAAARDQADPPATAPTSQPAMAFWKMLLPTASTPAANPRDSRREAIRTQLEQARLERSEMTDSVEHWHRAFYIVMTALPKTQETIDLLDRVLIQRTGMENSDSTRQSDDLRAVNRKADLMLAKEIRSRSVAWVAGTSVAFEGVVLLVAGWMFCRRDY